MFEWAEVDYGGVVRAAATAADGSRQRLQSSITRFNVPVQKARAQLREQHDKRGVDTKAVHDPNATERCLRFALGAGSKPQIDHDHGFLDDGHGRVDLTRKRLATTSDHFDMLQWLAKLEAAEMLRPDLVDATTAYRHFLYGGGRSRSIDYDRFLVSDSSGRRVMESVIEDVRAASIGWHDRQRTQSRAGVWTDRFQMHSALISVETDNPRYPYPGTENWQKAIGAHVLWVSSAEVTVALDSDAGLRRFTTKLTLEMEDMYNFNPGAEDIATGIPDSANGRFELTGLAHEYLTTGRISRTLTFTAPLDPTTSPRTAGSAADAGRTPRTVTPGDSRR
jgi:hypothetical protein